MPRDDGTSRHGEKLAVMDLFSGIGGFSLGLQWTGGFETVMFCEKDAWCRRVLAKHWPEVPCHDDIQTFGAGVAIDAGIERVDVICGGFPCQGVSTAGQGEGLSDTRSGLWFDMLRVIEEIRPPWTIIENVSALRNRGLDAVLGGLAAIGYDTEFHCIPACAVGAPHQRDRIWIVSYPNSERRDRQQIRIQPGRSQQEGAETAGLCGDVAYSDSQGRIERAGTGDERTGRSEPSHGSQFVSNADSNDGRARRQGRSDPGSPWQCVPERPFRDAHSPRLAFRQGVGGDARPQLTASVGADRRLAEPGVGREADGLPAGMDRPWSDGWEDGIARVATGVADRVNRLRGLGNAVVPQIPAIIGQAILDYERGKDDAA